MTLKRRENCSSNDLEGGTNRWNLMTGLGWVLPGSMKVSLKPCEEYKVQYLDTDAIKQVFAMWEQVKILGLLFHFSEWQEAKLLVETKTCRQFWRFDEGKSGMK